MTSLKCRGCDRVYETSQDYKDNLCPSCIEVVKRELDAERTRNRNALCPSCGRGKELQEGKDRAGYLSDKTSDTKAVLEKLRGEIEALKVTRLPVEGDRSQYEPVINEIRVLRLIDEAIKGGAQ